MSVCGHEWFVNGVSETARKNERGNQRKHLSHLRRTTIQSRRCSREREKKTEIYALTTNDFESTAPVDDMQSPGHYHVYSKERGCESRGDICSCLLHSTFIDVLSFYSLL